VRLYLKEINVWCRDILEEEGVLVREHKDSELSTATVCSRDQEEGELNGLVPK
jgi:hypothetical protein